jgi:hypothetical protein
MRSNIIYDTPPTMEVVDVKDMGFGTKYKGKQQVWTFKFTPERSGTYVLGNNEVGSLIDDIDQVPIIQNLTETINMDKAIFELKDATTTNTIIKALQGTI